MKRLTNHLLLALALSGCARTDTGMPNAELSDVDRQRSSAEIPASAGNAALAAEGAADGGAASVPVQTAAICGNGILEGGEVCDGRDCPTVCADAGAECVHVELSGTVATCDAQCVATEIVACVGGDGCCPGGCTHATDADCSPSCGDGVVSSDERCEPGSATSPCPSLMDCDDRDPCTRDTIVGSAQQCSAQCLSIPITQRVAGDQCCLPGANVSTDPDCAVACGDGVVSSGERCDPALRGSCPTVSTCARLTVSCQRGVLAGTDCEAHCEIEDVLKVEQGDQCCPPGANSGTDSDCAPRCGDGVVSIDEECDPNVPDGEYGRCPTRDADCSLPTSDPCQRGVLVGDPNQCTARCSIEPRKSGLRDACCPGGATSQDDPDCEAVCGNGLLERGETCDDGAGSTRPCPSNDDCRVLNGAGCSGRRLAGSASSCTAQCELFEITQAIPGDSCCPKTLDSSADPDCSDAASMYGPCTWESAYPPSYDERTGSVDPKASRPYGCDGMHSVCSAKWCDPLCEPGDTTDAEGRPGRCVKAFPNSFEVFCSTDADCPADRECGTTISSTVKTCLRGLRRS